MRSTVCGAPVLPLVRIRQWTSSMSCSPSSGRSASVWVRWPASLRSIAGLSAVEHRPPLGLRQRGADRQHHRAELHQRVDQHHLLAARAHGQRRGGAAPHPLGGEPPGHPDRLGLQLGVGDLGSVRDQGGAVGTGLGSLCEPVVEFQGSPGGCAGYRCPRILAGRGRSGAAITPRRSTLPRRHKEAPPEEALYAPIEWEAAARLRRHPLRARRRDREDHDQPARGPQRLPPADPGRAARRLRPGPRRPRGRLDHLHRRRHGGLLLGRRPADPRRRRLHRRRRGRPAGRRPARRRRPARADPPPAEAGGRDGRRLRGRRRPHPAPGLRPDDRRRQRPLRPDRAPGRQLRRRLRRQPPGPQHRRQARQGGLVPLPPLRRPRGARDGPGQRGRPARRPRARDRRLVPRDGRPLAALAAAAEGELQRRRRTASPGSSSSPTTRPCSST